MLMSRNARQRIHGHMGRLKQPFSLFSHAMQTEVSCVTAQA